MYSSLTSWFICPHSFASISFPSSCPLCVAVYICVPLVSAIGIVVFTIFEPLSPVNVESSRKPGAPHSRRVERQAECYTRHAVIYFLRTKDQFVCALKSFLAWGDTQPSPKLRALHSDRGGAYIARAVSD